MSKFAWTIPEDYEPNMAAVELEWFMEEYDGPNDDINYDILDDQTLQIACPRAFVEALVAEVGGSFRDL